ncbi:MAG: hypothetical protein M1826_002861 [Phylliscum demangeonii]|nr:MAG: hypothetical protein M1826_002861 [Phylliscum demangeonii]
MKSWMMMHAVAVVHLLLCAAGHASALPQQHGGEASVPENSNNNNNNHNGLRVSKPVLLLGDGVGAGLAALALRRGRPRQAPADAPAAAGLEPPRILLSSSPDEPVRPWTVPSAMAQDAVWMECIYDYLVVPPNGVVYLSPWVLADAISDCALHHGRHLDRSWLEAMHARGDAEIYRSDKRATAWARDQGQGDQVRDASPTKPGHFRDRAEMTTTTTGASAALQPHARSFLALPHWATRWRADLHRLLLARPAAYHQPSSGRARLDTLPLLEKEAAAVGF